MKLIQAFFIALITILLIALSLAVIAYNLENFNLLEHEHKITCAKTYLNEDKTIITQEFKNCD